MRARDSRLVELDVNGERVRLAAQHLPASGEGRRRFLLVHGNPSHMQHRIRAPILLVHGRGDRLVPIAYARRLFARIGHGHPRSKIVELEGGHMVHLTRPESVHEVLGRWLEEEL